MCPGPHSLRTWHKSVHFQGPPRHPPVLVPASPATCHVFEGDRLSLTCERALLALGLKCQNLV